MREIALTRGLIALVDDGDFDWLSQWKWCANSAGYAVRRVNGRTVTMHHTICEPDEGLVVDHINQHRLDNRRSNLRVCTQAQNTLNRRRVKGGFKGVRYRPHVQRYDAIVMVAGKRHESGLYHTAVAAALAYDEMARELHGEFACVNFPDFEVRAPAPIGRGYLSADARADRALSPAGALAFGDVYGFTSANLGPGSV